MNKNTNPENKNNQEQIDDFAKALLHKKTEMALYPEEKNENKNSSPLSSTQKRQAEKTLSSALDLLRQERGQLPIEEEEKQYANETDFDEEKDIDEFTSSSIRKDPLQNNEALNSIYTSLEHHEQKNKEESKKPTHLKPVKKKKEKTKKEKKERNKALDQPIRSRTKKNKEEQKKAEEKGAPKKAKQPPEWIKNLKPYRKQIFAFLIVFVLLLGGYTYKVAVYDPNNITNAQQEATYKKLVEYADEWDMLSEAEKMEIIELESSYDEMLEKQKKKINEYFIEQTTQPFTSQLASMKELKTQQEDETKPEYQELVAYISNWSTKDDADKANIVNYRDRYNALSDALKQKIDQIAIEQSQQSFATLLATQDAANQEAANQAAQAAKEERKANLEAQIESLTSQLNDAQAYNASLLADQAAGEDVQAAIDTNSQTISYLQQQIEAYQNELNTIQ